MKCPNIYKPNKIAKLKVNNLDIVVLNLEKHT